MLTILVAAVMAESDGPLETQVDAGRMRATVEKLASFNTRNTNSPELAQAAEWLASEYRKLPGLQVELMQYKIEKSRRVPADKDVVQVVAKLPGVDEEIILIGGHMDSLNLQADIFTGRAPGANDDASGTALVLELARVMSTRRWKHTLMFVAFSGEEQGLLGSRALAKRAKDENWKINAVLNNDTVGSSKNNNGESDPAHVRVFSEDKETHQSRELARFIEYVTRPVKNFGIKLIFRKDRFGRGGDHSPFNDQGVTAVRFVEVCEDYSRQHTPNDLPQYMDWNYLANVAKMNVLAMASLANAADAPTNVKVDLKQSRDTTINWTSKPGVKYVVYWRETTSPVWQFSRKVAESQTCRIDKYNKDDNVFAVGAEGGIPVEAK